MTIAGVAHCCPSDPPLTPYTDSVNRRRPMSTATFNGWANWETWNVSLWIQNDESLYKAAKTCRSYQDLVAMLWECGSKETPDGCRWDDPAIDGIEINDMMDDL